MTESGMNLILWVVAGALVGGMMAIPQPVDPWEFPSLTLSRSEVQEDIQRSEELAESAPDDDQVVRLRALFVGHGLAELNPPYTKLDYDEKQAQIHWTIDEIEKAHGTEAIAAIRARAVEDFIAMYASGRRELSEDDELGALGGFGQMLDRYGVIYREVLIAPEMTVRAMYKARWNLVHRIEATDGFSPIEQQAYWGWLALHGWGAPLQDRIDALAKYQAAGGANAEEASALFAVLAGRPDVAAQKLEALYVADGELRLRNLALGALSAANTTRR